MMQFCRSLSIAMVAALMALSSQVVAQDQTRFVLKLNDDLVTNLRSFGSLSSPVEPQFKNRISMIELQYEGKSDVPASTSNDAIVINGGVVGLPVTEALIATVKDHPVRINVPEGQRDFNKISLNYELTPLNDSSPSQPASQSNPVTPILSDSGQPVDMYFIKLSNGDSMNGGIDGLNKFAIETRFGSVSMPMDQVAGIKFHVDGKDSAVVVLNNGDTITGVPTIPAISLKTDWGTADIKPKFIESLTTTSNAKFTQSNSDFGLRWELKTGTSFAPGAPQAGGSVAPGFPSGAGS